MRTLSKPRISAVPEQAPRPALEVPADIAAAQGLADWRERTWWPIGIVEANMLAAEQAGRALRFAGELERHLSRDAVLLALPNILAYGRAILMAAVAVDRADRARVRLISGAPEFAFLRSGEGEIPDRSANILPPVPIRLELARRLLRVNSWSGACGTLAAIVSPDALAVSHNTLLQRAAAKSNERIGFRHADRILAAAQGEHTSQKSLDAEEIARSLALILAGNGILQEPYLSRTQRLLRNTAAPHIGKALRDMNSLRSVHLPARIWSGSGGLYAPRAVGLEVLRRGGEVVRFDHGKPKGFVESREIDAVVEFAVSSNFYVASKPAAEIARRHSDLGLVSWRSNIAIDCLDGDPTFASIEMKRSARAGRLRVVYAPTQLLGFRQLVPVQPPDVIYLDWQMRVAEFLNTLPVDFVCQAHPEGFVRRQAASAGSGRADAGAAIFMRSLQDADVFVFDYPTTTALWEACCTDARIVYLDMGAGRMTPEIARVFAQRATILPVAHGEHHRMTFDEAALREAVLARFWAGRSDAVPCACWQELPDVRARRLLRAGTQLSRRRCSRVPIATCCIAARIRRGMRRSPAGRWCSAGWRSWIPAARPISR